jgi:hypothetical protein
MGWFVRPGWPCPIALFWLLCGMPDACKLTLNASCTWLAQLLWLTSGLSEQYVKKRCCLARVILEDALILRLSRVCMGVTVMGQDCNYQLDITKLGRKRGSQQHFLMFFLKLISHFNLLPKKNHTGGKYRRKVAFTDQSECFLVIQWQGQRYLIQVEKCNWST